MESNNNSNNKIFVNFDSPSPFSNLPSKLDVYVCTPHTSTTKVVKSPETVLVWTRTVRHSQSPKSHHHTNRVLRLLSSFTVVEFGPVKFFTTINITVSNDDGNSGDSGDDGDDSCKKVGYSDWADCMNTYMQLAYGPVKSGLYHCQKKPLE